MWMLSSESFPASERVKPLESSCGPDGPDFLPLAVTCDANLSPTHVSVGDRKEKPAQAHSRFSTPRKYAPCVFASPWNWDQISLSRSVVAGLWLILASVAALSVIVNLVLIRLWRVLQIMIA